MILTIPSYSFYKKYHKNKINKLIHIVCIPMISWSICVFLKYYYSFILTLFYTGYYTNIFVRCMENPSILYISVLNIYLFLIWYSATLFNIYGENQNSFALGVFTLSWIFQFIGHGVFEKNRPALFDSLYQSFLMAPLFSFFEIEESRKKLDKDIEIKKQKINSEIEKEIITAEKEIKNLKKSSISNISKIASETSAELIKQIIDTEINRSNVAAIVNDIVKKEMDKHI